MIVGSFGGSVPGSRPLFHPTGLARFRRGMLAGMLLASGLVAGPVRAQTLYVLSTDTELATVSATNPGVVDTLITIVGVTAGETLVGIDVRPQNQRLYALGVNATTDTATLYHVAPETGQAVAVGSVGVGFTTDGTTPVDLPDPSTVDWDVDFNPAVDRFRVVAGALNFRMNPNTGALVDGDNTGLTSGTVTGTNPDGAINGGTTTVGGAAYTNNQPNNGNVTTLYTLDATTDSLFIQNPANAGSETLGQTVTLGGSALAIQAVLGFDIAPGVNSAASNTAVAAGSALAALRVGGEVGLYSIDLVDATATLVPGDLFARSIALRPGIPAATLLDASATALIRLNPATPGTTTTQALGALTPGETLVGIDGRPQTGQLMGLGVNATADTATLYLIDPQTGAVTAIGTASQIAFVDAGGNPVDLPDPATVGYGIDFNPTVDRLRVVTGSGLNFRVNPITGAPVDSGTPPTGINPDGPINGGTTGVDSTAYTNSFGQPLTGGTTTQYTLDATTNMLFIQNPPNAGTETFGQAVTLGGTPLDFTAQSGFDIPANVRVETSNTIAAGEGWAVLTVGGVSGLYRIDLTTGAATFVGALAANASDVVVWFSPAEIAVEAPTGTPVTDGSALVDFGAVLAGGTATRTITVRNLGNGTLDYTAELSSGAQFTITQNAAGSVSNSLLIEVTFHATTPGTALDTLVIASADGDEASFDVPLVGEVLAGLTDDIVTVTTGPTRLDVLANDGLGAAFTLDSVSEPTVVIDGRTLVIPAGFTGSFTYTATDGTVTGQATVTVKAGTAAAAPVAFNGVLTDANGEVAGFAAVTISDKGKGKAQLLTGAGKGALKLVFPAGVDLVQGATKLGNLDVTRNPNGATGTVGIALAATSGALTGLLHAAVDVATPVEYHVALASIDAAVPGGGFAILKVGKKGTVKVSGILPDGLPFSAKTTVVDNGSIAFFAPEKKAKPAGYVGGALVPADLAATDATGELAWVKPAQAPGAKGTQLGGVDTVLTANASLYAGVIPLTGAGTLRLSGGNLAADESNAVTIGAGGIPPLPTGALVAWTSKAKGGTFAAKVTLPAVAKAVKGSGIYLPKSNRAWGYFPGTTLGGRIELTVP